MIIRRNYKRNGYLELRRMSVMVHGTVWVQGTCAAVRHTRGLGGSVVVIGNRTEPSTELSTNPTLTATTKRIFLQGL
jgi:hypothetical protein